MIIPIDMNFFLTFCKRGDVLIKFYSTFFLSILIYSHLVSSFDYSILHHFFLYLLLNYKVHFKFLFLK